MEPASKSTVSTVFPVPLSYEWLLVSEFVLLQSILETVLFVILVPDETLSLDAVK